MIRKRTYEVIEKAEGKDSISAFYDYAMIVIIVISIIPLAFKTETTLFRLIDKFTVAIFIIDYGLRWLTADYKFSEHSASAFLRYPFSPMAVVDLVSILPSLSLVNSGFSCLGY